VIYPHTGHGLDYELEEVSKLARPSVALVRGPLLPRPSSLLSRPSLVSVYALGAGVRRHSRLADATRVVKRPRAISPIDTAAERAYGCPTHTTKVSSTSSYRPVISQHPVVGKLIPVIKN
jgi:hypothetical protein